MSDGKMYDIPHEVRGRVMAGLALAWDGQWFLKVKDRFGWDAAAEINATAVIVHGGHADDKDIEAGFERWVKAIQSRFISSR